MSEYKTHPVLVMFVAGRQVLFFHTVKFKRSFHFTCIVPKCKRSSICVTFK